MDKYIYMDHAATTPLDPEVLRGMSEAAENLWQNPSSIYQASEACRAALENAREKVATLINAGTNEIVFTSGGTEADNWAIAAGLEYGKNKGKHIITSATEHPAILRTCEYLERSGRAEVSYLDTDEEGRVSLEQIEKAIRKDTVLISVMLANNETGTIQPVKEIARIAHDNGILFHSDAVQAVGHIPVDVAKLQPDLLSASGHKFYGPKGSGFLYIRKGLKLPPFIHGGGQEKNRRAGTENIAGIVGVGIAAEQAAESLQLRMKKERELSEYLISGLKKEIPFCRLNGPEKDRLPGHVNVSFKTVPAEYILVTLDMHRICASAGSACAAGLPDPSHVLRAMGRTMEEAYEGIRYSLSWMNTKEEIDQVIACTAKAVARYRVGSRTARW